MLPKKKNENKILASIYFVLFYLRTNTLIFLALQKLFVSHFKDPVLREVLRNRTGLPILYIAFNAIMLENPSTASLMAAEKKTETELRPTSHQQTVIQKLKIQTFGEEKEVVKKKRKKVKGPNPLSCKKSKKKKTDIKPKTGSEETKKRKKRKKKHKSAHTTEAVL